jgi:excisionase family DNA binding protein
MSSNRREGTGMVTTEAPALPLLLTVDEVAHQLSINRATVYAKLIRPGVLRTVPIGRSRRVTRRDLEAFVDSLRGESGGGGRDDNDAA